MKVAVVTGSNTGIGLQTATQLCAQGYNVVMACRSQEKAEQAMEGIRKECGGKGKVSFLALDTSSLASAKAFAVNFLKAFDRLDALVLNAGTGYVQRDQRTTGDGNEAFFQINYLSHWLLTQHLTPLLKSTQDSRVVCLSSVEHRAVRTFNWEKLNTKTTIDSYRGSKMAMTLFAFELARRTGLPCAAANPGAVLSDIAHTPDWRKSSPSLSTRIFKFGAKLLFLTPAQGACTSVYGATEPLPKGEAVYLSPYADTGCCPKASDTLNFFNGPTIRKADKKAYDQQQQKYLWEFSAKLCEKYMP